MQIRSERKKRLSYKAIGEKHGIDWRTAKKYSLSEEKPVYRLKEPKKSKLDKYKGQIDLMLEEAAYSAVVVMERLAETEKGFDCGYTTIKNYVRKKKGEYENKATVRFETMPGLQGQVDWAHFEDHRVWENGIYKKVYCFLMILGYSRMRYIEFVTDMTTDTLIRCHINAFRYFGGYPQEILYDNMKQVVVKRLLRQKDSTLNKQFEDFAGFYGFAPILCRPYRGQTKGKVERTVRYVRENFMTGIKYDSLDDLNGQALKWCRKVNSKIHGTTYAVPFDRLKEEHLSPLMREYIIDKINLRKVEKDCLISYAGNKYSIPSEYACKYVTVVVLENMLAAYFQGKQIALHKLSYHKKTMNVNPEHYRKLTQSQHFDTQNLLLNTRHFDSVPFEINLEVYDS